MRRKILSIMLILVLLVSIPVSGQAAELSVVQPRYTYIVEFNRDLTINTSTGVADCYAKITANANYPVEVVCRFEVYWGGEWMTLRTWTDTGNMMAVISETYDAPDGFNYRIDVTAYVYDSNGNRLEVTGGITECYYPKN